MGALLKKQRQNQGQFSFSIYFPALESTWIVLDGHLISGITCSVCTHTAKFINGLVHLWTGSEPVQYSEQRVKLEPNQCDLGPNWWFGSSSKPVHKGSELDHSNTSQMASRKGWLISRE